MSQTEHDKLQDALALSPTAVSAPAAPMPARALQRLADNLLRKGALKEGAPAGKGFVLPSPCINVCTMGQALASPAEPLCLGCLRSLPEIIEWGSAAIERRQAIWRDVLLRIDAVQSGAA